MQGSFSMQGSDLRKRAANSFGNGSVMRQFDLGQHRLDRCESVGSSLGTELGRCAFIQCVLQEFNHGALPVLQRGQANT